MTQSDIQSWLEYWRNANMVATEQITAFDQVYQARKYCSCMRVGVFSPDLITDLQIWRALCAMRSLDASLARENRVSDIAAVLMILSTTEYAEGCPIHGTLEYHNGRCFTCDESES